MSMQPARIPQWTVADRLRKARETAGLDQAQLADRMGVSRNTISNNEHARVKPRRIVLNAWALATGVPVQWLQDGTTPGPGDGQWAPWGSNPQPTDYASAPLAA